MKIGWAIEKEGNKRASFILDKKSDAEQKAIECAKSEHSELIVHKKDGKIDWRNSYITGQACTIVLSYNMHQITAIYNCASLTRYVGAMFIEIVLIVINLNAYYY